MNLSLEGKQALVGGSTQGIGLAIAKELALLGATCTLLARNEEKLKTAAASLSTEKGQRHHWLVADFSRPEELQQVVTAWIRNNTCHILVNNTGGPEPGPITKAAPGQFVDAFRQHIVVNQLLVQALLPGMQAAHYGRIVNVVSTSVKMPLPNLGVSNTIRSAVAGWAKTLSNEVAAQGITVNNILPGFISTARLDALTAANAAAAGISVAEQTGKMADSVPAGRIGTVEEVAAVAAFLCSPAAAYVNGESIRVDGGRTGSI